MKRGTLLVILIIVTTLILTGCSQNTSSSRTDNVLILAIGGEPEEGFDPTTGWGRYGSPLFQSTLLKRDKDMKIVNDLASVYEVSPDGLEWTVSIRKDVVFTDGIPLQAEDIAFTFQTAARSGSVIDLTNLVDVEAVDDYKVVFTLKKPQSTFIDLLVTTGIVPKHAYTDEYAQNPIGSGPYSFVQWDKGQQLIVEANPEYYGTKPNFIRITFLFLGEDAAYTAAKAGQVHVAAIPSIFGKKEVNGMRLVSIQSVDNRGIMFPVIRSGSLTEDGYPLGNDVTAEVSIRKAINLAVDRNALVEGVLEGFGTPAYTVCDGLPWWNPETVIRDGDLEEAEKILTEAGWHKSNGILEKDGLKAEFTLLYPAGDQIRQSLAIVVADMVRPLGILINTQGKSWDEINRLAHANAVLYGWGSHTPLEMYNLYHSSNSGRGYYNPGFYSNPVVDEYMELAQASLSEEEALAYWQKAQWDGQDGLGFQGDAPWAWLVNLNHLYLVSDRIDIGTPKIEPHGHGWPITDNIVEWSWNE